jgi:hypothetical protein
MIRKSPGLVDTLTQILCVPLADRQRVSELSALDDRRITDAFVSWLTAARTVHTDLEFEVVAEQGPDGHPALEFRRPVRGRAALVVQRVPSLDVDELAASGTAADCTLALGCWSLQAPPNERVEAPASDPLSYNPGLLVLEPEWLAALVVDRSLPMLPRDPVAASQVPFRLAFDPFD